MSVVGAPLRFAGSAQVRMPAVQPQSIGVRRLARLHCDCLLKPRKTKILAKPPQAAGADGDVVALPGDAAAATATNAAGYASLASLLIDNTVKAPYLWYSRSLQEHPLTTKALTSCVGFVLGDLVAQHMSHPHFVDVVRAARLGLYGLCIDGPVGSIWYDILEQRVYPEQPFATKTVLIKTALDQTVYATIMTAVYFVVIRLLEGHPDAVMSTLASKFWPTLAANYVVWPLAHLINFRFVPSEFRILYNNVICIAWLTFLSLLTHTNAAHLFSSLLHGGK